MVPSAGLDPATARFRLTYFHRQVAFIRDMIYSRALLAHFDKCPTSLSFPLQEKLSFNKRGASKRGLLLKINNNLINIFFSILHVL
jgi:hypothetical protein